VYRHLNVFHVLVRPKLGIRYTDRPRVFSSLPTNCLRLAQMNRRYLRVQCCFINCYCWTSVHH